MKIFQSSCPLGLGIDPSQQTGIPFGIEDDHHVPAADVLGDQEFGQPGLADPGGAQHQGVADPLTDVHPDRLFVRFYRMQGGFAANRR